MTIIGSTQKQLRVGRESDGSDCHGVTFDGVHQLAALHVEDVDESIDGTTRYVFSILALLNENCTDLHVSMCMGTGLQKNVESIKNR